MRRDMPKVLVERPRGGAGKLRPRKPPGDEDALPAKIGLKRDARLRGGQKRLNENLAPLRRYLESQVGRPWNKVWAEVCDNLKLASTVQKHVRDHIPEFVATKTSVHDGSVWVHDRWRFQPLSECGVLLFVDPNSGLLRRNQHRSARTAERRRRQAADQAARAKRLRVLSPTTQLHLLADGAWWEVTLAPIPTTTVEVPTRHGRRRQQVEASFLDVIRRAQLSTLEPRTLYGCDGVYAVAMRQLSKKQIRAFALR